MSHLAAKRRKSETVNSENLRPRRGGFFHDESRALKHVAQVVKENGVVQSVGTSATETAAQPRHTQVSGRRQPGREANERQADPPTKTGPEVIPARNDLAVRLQNKRR